MGKLKWTLDDAPANNDWQGIAYGNGLFVAVAESGTNRIMTSSDGINWTARPAPVNKYWNGIAYGNGKFVVVGLGGSPWTMSSTDGINWTTGSVVGYTGNGFYNVAYGNGKFVAVSSEGIIVSTDGENWTTTRKVTQDSYWRDVAYGNGLFVVVANYGIYRIITSPDGITWTERHDEVDSFFSNIYNWKGITYGNGLFVVINGNMGTGYNSIITSPDGINWTVVFEEANNIWQSVAYGDGLFVISGYNETLVSTNGVNWHREFLAENSLFTSNICYGDEKFVVISAYGYGKIATANWPAPYNFDYGNGTEEDPYEIWTPEDLDGVRDYLEDTSIHFIQKVNIDLSGFTNWVPIGDATGSGHFSGFYDGNNFIVSNLTMIYSSFRAIGLFGSILDGSVSNLGIENININSSGTIVGAGGLAGAFHSDNRSLYKISNCYCKGTVIAENNAGLLIGIVTGFVINCWSEGTVRGIIYKYVNAGGLVGKIISGEIHKCYSLANVEGVEVGGLIGSVLPGVAIENCYAMGNVTGTRFAGGLIGNSYSPYLANCYSKGFVSLTPLVINNIGGLIGMNDSSIIVTPCYYDSDVSGQSDTGKGEPKTTAEMKQQSTYENWDFNDVWNINPTINDGYPYLRIEKINIDIPTSPILELLKDIELPSHRTHLYISEEQKINLATKYGIGSLIVASGIYPETLIELDSLVNSYWEHTTKDIKLKWKQILYTNINGYIKLDNIIINDMFNYLTNEELIIGDLIQLQDNLIIPIPPLPVIEWTPSWVNGLYEELKETDDETLINDGLVEWDWYVTMDDELYKVLKNNPSLDETDEFLEASDVLSLIKKINNTIKPMN